MCVRWAMAVGLLAILLGAGSTEAVAQTPLPGFRVVRPDGTAVSSAQLAPGDQWLLIYLAPGCPSCDRLLAALKDWQSPALLERAVIVVGGQAPTAQSYIQRTEPSEVSSIAWYADAGNEAWTALRLTGTPVLVGVRKGVVEWAVSGVLNDPAALESVVKTWVGQ